MLDFVQLSAALLALIGLCLWFWSSRLGVSQGVEGGHQTMALHKRRIRQVAICAAVISALLQAAAAAAPAKELEDVELWASTAPAAVLPIA
jgi:hypothetical protein